MTLGRYIERVVAYDFSARLWPGPYMLRVPVCNQRRLELHGLAQKQQLGVLFAMEVDEYEITTLGSLAREHRSLRPRTYVEIPALAPHLELVWPFIRWSECSELSPYREGWKRARPEGVDPSTDGLEPSGLAAGGRAF